VKRNRGVSTEGRRVRRETEEGDSEKKKKRERAYECMLKVGAPISTVLNPILLTNGPIVDPHAQSFLTRYSCNGTPACAAIRRRGKTVWEVVA
jgi:hypothetical protein